MNQKTVTRLEENVVQRIPLKGIAQVDAEDFCRAVRLPPVELR